MAHSRWKYSGSHDSEQARTYTHTHTILWQKSILLLQYFFFDCAHKLSFQQQQNYTTTTTATLFSSKLIFFSHDKISKKNKRGKTNVKFLSCSKLFFIGNYYFVRNTRAYTHTHTNTLDLFLTRSVWQNNKTKMLLRNRVSNKWQELRE